MKKFFKTVPLFYFLIIIFLCKAICKKKVLNKSLLIKTDRLGDTIIWQSIGYDNYYTVMRQESLKSDYPIDIYKLYMNPKYTWKVFKSLYGTYNEIVVPVASKTAEMIALSFLCSAENKTTIKDDNVNMFACNSVERYIFNTRKPNMLHEYENVIAFQKGLDPKIPWSSLEHELVIFMPFASNKKRQLTLTQFEILLSKFEQYQINVKVIGLVDENEQKSYEQIIERYASAESKINQLRLKDYTIYKGAVYIGMDTSVFHLFYQQKLCKQYYVITGLGYNFRFVPKEENISAIYNHCNDSNCSWNCKFSDYRCVTSIEFDV